MFPNASGDTGAIEAIQRSSSYGGHDDDWADGSDKRGYKQWTAADDELLVRYKVNGDSMLSFHGIAETTGRSVMAVKSRWHSVLKNKLGV